MNTTTDKQRLVALQLLDNKLQREESKMKEMRKDWADKLSESTTDINESIRGPIPSDAMAPSKWEELVHLDEKKQGIERKKKKSLDDIKLAIDETKSVFHEILRRAADPNQMNINYGAEGKKDSADAGIILSQPHLKVVRDAIDGFEPGESGEMDGFEDLKQRVEDMGCEGFEFPEDYFDDPENSAPVEEPVAEQDAQKPVAESPLEVIENKDVDELPLVVSGKPI